MLPVGTYVWKSPQEVVKATFIPTDVTMMRLVTADVVGVAASAAVGVGDEDGVVIAVALAAGVMVGPVDAVPELPLLDICQISKPTPPAISKPTNRPMSSGFRFESVGPPGFGRPVTGTWGGVSSIRGNCNPERCP